MRLFFTVIALATVPFIHGCAALAIGGAAAAGGYLVGEDRRPVNIMAEDQTIESRIGQRVGSKHTQAHINATSYNKLVLLTGEAPSDAAKADIEAVARDVPGVKAIVNEIQIAGNASLPARANDSYVTSKVKGRFVDARRFNPLHVKVVTEAGVVYLLGLVTRMEADTATDLARTTSGVQKVVRVFEYRD
jgi:osmotically-inducible protein OsmY